MNKINIFLSCLFMPVDHPCMGCHEEQNSTPLLKRALTAFKTPPEITSWYGPARGLSFPRDVQPVLDRFCVGCHDGAQQSQGKPLPDLRAMTAKGPGNFDPSYMALHPAEAWDRLYTWIDLNVPDHGTWGEHRGGDVGQIRKMRLDMNVQTANDDTDPELISNVSTQAIAFAKPPPEAPVPEQDIKADGWPFDAATETKQRD